MLCKPLVINGLQMLLPAPVFQDEKQGGRPINGERNEAGKENCFGGKTVLRYNERREGACFFH